MTLVLWLQNSRTNMPFNYSKGGARKVMARLFVHLGRTVICCVCKESMEKQWYQWLFHQSRKPSSWHGKLYTLIKEAQTDGSFYGVLALSRKKIDITLDHRRPVSKGGTNELTNLGFAHRKCNSQKGNYFNENDE